MEIEWNLGKTNYWREMTIVIIVLILSALGILGWAVTDKQGDGSAQLLTWSGYQIDKAERIYQNERRLLREDANMLSNILDKSETANPVIVQVAVNRIQDHASTGVDELTEARNKLSAAALSVRNWSIGLVDKNSAIQAVQNAVELLSE